MTTWAPILEIKTRLMKVRSNLKSSSSFSHVLYYLPVSCSLLTDDLPLIWGLRDKLQSQAKSSPMPVPVNKYSQNKDSSFVDI